MTLHRTGQRTALAMIVIVIGVAVMASECAHAQPICGQRAEIVAELEGRWGEQQRAFGVSGGSLVFEVLVNPRTGTWTILSTTPDGVTCAVAAGDQWTEQPIGDPT